MSPAIASPRLQTGVVDLNVGKREQTKVANRQAILDAAREVFGELGYETATVRDIIRRTGLAAGTFYNYFRSKEEVFAALADDEGCSGATGGAVGGRSSSEPGLEGGGGRALLLFPAAATAVVAASAAGAATETGGGSATAGGGPRGDDAAAAPLAAPGAGMSPPASERSEGSKTPSS